MQGADKLALTKMDVLSYLDRIPVCTAYDVNGTITHEFPFGDHLNEAKPVIEYVPGWHCDISSCRKKEDLPKEALDYVAYLEKAVGCKIRYVSVYLTATLISTCIDPTRKIPFAGAFL